jgi:N-alpha-acetyl-L-2,4-diaminobutyrate deacetylase
MCVDLGESISAGSVIARVHAMGRTGVAAREYRAALDGILAARHFPGIIRTGDTLAVVAVQL